MPKFTRDEVRLPESILGSIGQKPASNQTKRSRFNENITLFIIFITPEKTVGTFLERE